MKLSVIPDGVSPIVIQRYEISFAKSDNVSRIDIALFDIKSGWDIVRPNGVQQSNGYDDLFGGTGFIVENGFIMIRVADDDFPYMHRQLLC